MVNKLIFKKLISFKNVLFLPIDNVHNQHSMLLIRQLNQLNIDYDLQIYPDDNHYLSKSAAHLYSKMTNYFQNKCFKNAPVKRHHQIGTKA